MINTVVNIHDKFSVEFKIGFFTSKEGKEAEQFKINTWIFTPNGLDINRYTYSKEQFYSDIKANVRLITPIYSLGEILDHEHGPFVPLKAAIDQLIENPNEETEEDYVYHTKMLPCILKSALREHANAIFALTEGREQVESAKQLIAQVEEIKSLYRNIKDEVLASDKLSGEQKDYFLFGDEYLGSIVEGTAYLLMRRLEHGDSYHQIKQDLIALVEDEFAYKRRMGYALPEKGEEEHNSLTLINRSILKKYAESDLYLQRTKKADGVFAREIYYSIAAGIAMFFATIISFVATQKFGNFTSSLFIALILGYMFKDRIKEAARIYFSSRLDQKYFDWKWKVNLRNKEIGWIKEAFDFISQHKVPAEIIALRKKTPLVKAENNVYDEKVILYRKRVLLSKKEIEDYKGYHLSGINDIIRLNLMSFIKKMDNPVIPMYLPNEETGYDTILGNRAYALYFILECKSEDESYYKSYRALFNRNGISDVREI